MLAVIVLLATPVFRVTHHVSLPDGLVDLCDARRDGSAAGSLGYMWTSSGRRNPMIVRNGKCIALHVPNQEEFSAAALILGKDRYLIQGWKKSFTVQFSRGRCMLVSNPSELPKPQPWVASFTEKPTSQLHQLLPVPKEISDTMGLDVVSWTPIDANHAVGTACFTRHMLSHYRAVFRGPDGKLSTLESRIPGMDKFMLGYVHFVSPDGWAVIEANARRKNDQPAVSIRHGRELIWIEWKQPKQKS